MPAIPSVFVSILAYMMAPTASIAQPKPLSKVWLCQGERNMSRDHTGHSNPNGGPMGQPMMKVAKRNQLW